MRHTIADRVEQPGGVGNSNWWELEVTPGQAQRLLDLHLIHLHDDQPGQPSYVPGAIDEDERQYFIVTHDGITTEKHWQAIVDLVQGMPNL